MKSSSVHRQQFHFQSATKAGNSRSIAEEYESALEYERKSSRILFQESGALSYKIADSKLISLSNSQQND